MKYWHSTSVPFDDSKSGMPLELGRQDLLHRRLQEFTDAMRMCDNCLALIGLGSSGLAANRMDAYSDLDLFIIVQDGYKHKYLESLGWLEAISPLDYIFRNSVDGYKVLFQDGIFCEFAIFEMAEMTSIPYTDARVIWAAESSFKANQPRDNKVPIQVRHEIQWYVDEVLTNVYVGLLRQLRGEKLNAYRFIQGYAVDRFIELLNQKHPEKQREGDPFSKTRRFEQLFPEASRQLSHFIQGYDGNVESALAILEFLDKNFDVNEKLREVILKLVSMAGVDNSQSRY